MSSEQSDIIPSDLLRELLYEQLSGHQLSVMKPLMEEFSPSEFSSVALPPGSVGPSMFPGIHQISSPLLFILDSVLSGLLVTPHSRLRSFGDHDFSVVPSPPLSLWNSLPAPHSSPPPPRQPMLFRFCFLLFLLFHFFVFYSRVV